MAQFESKQAAWEYYLSLDSYHFQEKQHDNIYTEAFEAGAEWNQKRLLEKACEWLRKNYTSYMINDLSKYVEDVCSFDIFDDLLVDDFRKAMEE